MSFSDVPHMKPCGSLCMPGTICLPAWVACKVMLLIVLLHSKAHMAGDEGMSKFMDQTPRHVKARQQMVVWTKHVPSAHCFIS
jgi:hypothetical protein